MKLDQKLAWIYDEFKQVGKDYTDQAEVDLYDPSHADFRDIESESKAALDMLGVQAGEVVIDFGCGTGTFVLEAARRGCQVFAVDVSGPMLARAREKAAQAGLAGITFCHAGFLTFELAAETAHAMATTFSFHHLPDFWKGIALKRMNRMLAPGGRLYLRDVIIQEAQALENISHMIEEQERLGGAFLRDDAEGHFRDEYSTYEWVMDGLLARAGFHLIEKTVEGGVIGTYLCEKPHGPGLRRLDGYRPGQVQR